METKKPKMTDDQFLTYLNILAMPYDITITSIGAENHVVEMNGSDRSIAEFAMVLDEQLGEYLV